MTYIGLFGALGLEHPPCLGSKPVFQRLLEFCLEPGLGFRALGLRGLGQKGLGFRVFRGLRVRVQGV